MASSIQALKIFKDGDASDTIAFLPIPAKTDNEGIDSFRQSTVQELLILSYIL